MSRYDNYDNYDYYGNFIVFLQNNNIVERVAELSKKKLKNIGNYDTLSNETAIKLFLERLRAPDDVINSLCTWGAQPERSDYWANLHEEWRHICYKGVVLTNTLYKSIW